MTLDIGFYDIPDRNVCLSKVTSRLAGTGCRTVSTYTPVILTLVFILPKHLNKSASRNELKVTNVKLTFKNGILKCVIVSPF